MKTANTIIVTIAIASVAFYIGFRVGSNHAARVVGDAAIKALQEVGFAIKEQNESAAQVTTLLSTPSVVEFAE